MWLDKKERERLQNKLNEYLKREAEDSIQYRFLVEDLVKKLDRNLAFVLIALLEGYTGVEIAACLGVSSSTVTAYKKKLRKIIKSMYKTEKN